jgi:hypothetical protein
LSKSKKEEGTDLIYEGITTDGCPRLAYPLFALIEGTDLIYEGITTLSTEVSDFQLPIPEKELT